MLCPKCKSEEIIDIEAGCDLFGLLNDIEAQWICSNCQYKFNDKDVTEKKWYEEKDFAKMSLSNIADVILADWDRNVAPEATPYIKAMLSLETMGDIYGNESARNIVLHFLTNAGQWKGETAKEIKKILRKKIELSN